MANPVGKLPFNGPPCNDTLKETLAPGENPSSNKLRKELFTRVTVLDRSPLTPPSRAGDPEDNPPSKLIFDTTAVFCPSAMPLPSVMANRMEKGPAGWPTSPVVFMDTS